MQNYSNQRFDHVDQELIVEVSPTFNTSGYVKIKLKLQLNSIPYILYLIYLLGNLNSILRLPGAIYNCLKQNCLFAWTYLLTSCRRTFSQANYSNMLKSELII